MHDATVAEGIRRKYEVLEPVLDERARRQWAAAEAMGLGWGGVSLVASATGISRTTINAGVRELKDRTRPDAPPVMARVRRPGGGSKSLATIDAGLLDELEAIIAPETRGDPMSPYGVYDLTANKGWVSVGTDHDTARFAARTILCWWRKMGRVRYPEATELLITADGGGSNSSRCRLWKIALQELADATGLTLHVSHFPPGTSKWNKIEHRLFCHVTQNWRGRPLVSHDLIVKLIGSTTTQTGLKVKAALDKSAYQRGIKVTDEELEAVNIRREDFHGDWNYTISPTDKVG